MGALPGVTGQKRPRIPTSLVLGPPAQKVRLFLLFSPGTDGLCIYGEVRSFCGKQHFPIVVLSSARIIAHTPQPSGYMTAYEALRGVWHDPTASGILAALCSFSLEGFFLIFKPRAFDRDCATLYFLLDLISSLTICESILLLMLGPRRCVSQPPGLSFFYHEPLPPCV